jgi:tetratricopeptide (TPR) repeat protein
MKKKHAFGKRFARMTVLISTILMAVLFVVAAILYHNRTKLLTDGARQAAESGDYEKAVSLLSSAERDEQSEETLTEYRYQLALSYLNNGNPADALTLFSQLGEYRDSRERITECRYRAAELLYEKGEYEAAKDAFFALAGYSDALDRYDACRYAIADQTEPADPKEAFTLFRALGGYGDAKARSEAIAVRLTGESDPEYAVNAMLGISNEMLEEMRSLSKIREALPKNRLAVGFYHTVGLRSDGTAIAAGRNTEGQCDVSGGSNLVAIDCGAYHTVGLRSDGTVVAAGRNTEGQCSVSEWTGITAVVCTDYNTLGLKADGTVVSTGFQDYPTLSGWRNVARIGGGSYAVCAVTEDGQYLSSHAAMRSETVRDCIEVDPSTGYCIGLSADGTLSGVNAAMPGWTDLVAISAGSTGYLGLTKDGQVLSYWFRARDAIDFSDLQNAVAIAAGGTHSAVLLSDGSVAARGANDFGECDVASWNLGATALD